MCFMYKNNALLKSKVFELLMDFKIRNMEWAVNVKRIFTFVFNT